MTDLWSFLLQTLTASGAALLLLAVKALFRDKLSPRWQWGVWAVLALTLLLPAGRGGRYALFNWPLWLETAKTALTGDYALTRVLSPLPQPSFAPPHTVYDIIFYVYCMGVLLCLLHYLLSYLRLRLALGRGAPADGARIARVAERYGLKPCRAVEVQGLPTAFVCGVFRPVLALPAGAEADDKVILHELLHLKYHDAAWGLLICALRCLHWCNPLLWHCADLAQNDAEALCDQRVLELLQGEERRDYGRILLSMAGERYARAPGTSSLSNGGRNIKARIAAIARFKRYPRGMALVSVCAALVLGLGCVGGVRAAGAAEFPRDPAAAMAYARTRRCTTVAGALDVYAKALLFENGYAMAMATPVSGHTALAARLGPGGSLESPVDRGEADFFSGALYAVYNLHETGPDTYAALLVFPSQGGSEYNFYLQPLEVARGDGWEVSPGRGYPLRSEEAAFGLTYGNAGLPYLLYAGTDGEVRVELETQYVLSTVSDHGGFFPAADPLPLPDARFTHQNRADPAGRLTRVSDGSYFPFTGVRYEPLSLRELETDGRARTYGPYWSGDRLSVASNGSSGGGMERGLDCAPAGFRFTFTDELGEARTLLLALEKGGLEP